MKECEVGKINRIKMNCRVKIESYTKIQTEKNEDHVKQKFVVKINLEKGVLLSTK